MKNLIPVILLIAVSYLNVNAQQYEPQLLVLSPGKVTFESALKNEIDTKNAEAKKMGEQASQQSLPSDGPANFKLMTQSMITFAKDMTFAKEISLFAQNYLTYRFYEKFPNCLLLLKDTTSTGKLDDLQKIAETGHTPYILNFPAVLFYKEKGETFCKMRVQLYEQQSNSLLIDKEYTGDWNNPGFEFTCDQGTVGCTINNSLSKSLADIISQVAANNPTLKRERALALQRSAYITNVVYPQPFDTTIIRLAIPRDSTKIELSKLYQCFYNDDHTQFVGFFIKHVEKNPKGLLGEKEDSNVKVITSKDIHDKDYLNQSPQTYAYIVKGIKYQDKWYIEKSEVTYFDADNIKEGQLRYLNNLQQWGFFADNSDKPGTSFWDGELFKKITDLRKDPDWEQKKRMWAIEEHENRDYIGLYELVANKLKAEKSEENDAFRIKILYGTLNPFYKDQAKHRSNHIITVNDTTELFNLIYPKDKHVILNPTKIIDENGDTYIRFFVLLPQTSEIFEWTLVKPYLLKKGEYTDDPVTKTIGAFTTWDYTYATLDDDKFWAEKVLTKENGHYKYLTKLK